MNGSKLSDDEIRLLESLLRRIGGDGAHLPPVLFRFLTEIAATTNVDLLVRDDRDRVLLAWRDDAFGTGWHVPGSIIRHREEIAHRLRACAADELGCEVASSDGPVALVQIFDDRGHSMSLCFGATLRGTPARRVIAPGDIPEPGDLCWFDAVPDRLYPSHIVYRDVIATARAGRLAAPLPVFTQHVGRRDAEQDAPSGMISADAPLTRLE